MEAQVIKSSLVAPLAVFCGFGARLFLLYQEPHRVTICFQSRAFNFEYLDKNCNLLRAKFFLFILAIIMFLELSVLIPYNTISKSDTFSIHWFIVACFNFLVSGIFTFEPFFPLGYDTV
jgi:hypothetical protein